MSEHVYSKEDCIDALQEAAEKLSHPPTHKEYGELELYPSADTIKRLLGGWNEAKVLAGFDSSDIHNPPRKGEPPKWQSYTQSEWESLSPSVRTRSRKQSVVSQIKVERGCNNCGYSKSPPALSFHHINRDEKRSAISKMIAQGNSMSEIMDEVGKCEVLCANCHREGHYG